MKLGHSRLMGIFAVIALITKRSAISSLESLWATSATASRSNCSCRDCLIEVFGPIGQRDSANRTKRMRPDR